MSDSLSRRRNLGRRIARGQMIYDPRMSSVSSTSALSATTTPSPSTEIGCRSHLARNAPATLARESMSTNSWTVVCASATRERHWSSMNPVHQCQFAWESLFQLPNHLPLRHRPSQSSPSSGNLTSQLPIILGDAILPLHGVTDEHGTHPDTRKGKTGFPLGGTCLALPWVHVDYTSIPCTINMVTFSFTTWWFPRQVNQV